MPTESYVDFPRSLNVSRAASVAALLLLLAACGTDGTVPRMPESMDTLHLSSEVVIGREPEQAFGHITAIGTASDGTALVADSYSGQLRVFSPEGEELARFGRTGQGPGEFGLVTAISSVGDTLWAIRDVSNARVTIASMGGEFVTSWSAAGVEFSGTKGLVTTPSGNLVLTSFESGAIVAETRSPSGAEVGKPVRFPMTHFDACPKQLIAGPGTPVIPLSSSLQWSIAPQGGIYFSCGDEFEVSIETSAGTDKTIRSVTPPVSVSAGERDFYRDWINNRMHVRNPRWRWDGSNIPSTKPPILGLYATDRAGLWIALPRPGAPEPKPPRASEVDPDPFWFSPKSFEVIGLDGHPLAIVEGDRHIQLTVDPSPWIGGLWAVSTDPIGTPLLVHYRLDQPLRSLR